MPRIPTQGLSGQMTGRLQAGQVVPFQNQAPQQMQQFGRALEFTGANVAALGADIEAENDAARVKEAVKQFRAFSQAQLSTKDGYRARYGKEAQDTYQETSDAFRQRKDSLYGALQNDQQRQMFSDAADAILEQSRATMDGHYAQQTRAYNISETDAALKTEIEGYVESRDPATLSRVRQQVDEFADLARYGPEQRERAMKDALAQAHAGAFDALMAEEDTDGARAYLSQHGGAMGSTTRTRAESLLRKAVHLEKVQRIGDEIIDKGGSLMDQLEAVRRMSEGENPRVSATVRADLERRLEHAADRRRAEESRAAVEALTTAQEWAATGAPLTPEMAQALEDTGQMWKYDAWLNQDQGWQTSGYGFRSLTTMSDQELLRFKSEDEVWDTFRTEMSDKHLPLMVGRWQGAMEAAGKSYAAQQAAMGKDAFELTQHKQILHWFRKLPEIPENLEKPDGDRIAMFDRFEKAVIDTANANARGRQATSKDLDDAAEQVMAKKLYLDKDGTQPMTAALMTQSQYDASYTKTGFGILKTSEVSDEQYFQAEQKLMEDNAKLRAQGKPAAPVTEAAVWTEIHRGMLAFNKENSENRKQERERGFSLLAQEVRRLLNDSALAREWRMADPYGAPRRVLPGKNYSIPDARFDTVEQRGAFLMLERIGSGIGENYDLQNEEMLEFIESMLRPGRSRDYWIEMQRDRRDEAALAPFMEAAGGSRDEADRRRLQSEGFQGGTWGARK